MHCTSVCQSQTVTRKRMNYLTLLSTLQTTTWSKLFYRTCCVVPLGLAPEFLTFVKCWRLHDVSFNFFQTSLFFLEKIVSTNWLFGEMFRKTLSLNILIQATCCYHSIGLNARQRSPWFCWRSLLTQKIEGLLFRIQQVVQSSGWESDEQCIKL